MPIESGDGGLVGLAGVPEGEGGDFGGKVTSPESEGGVGGFGKRGGGKFAVTCDEDLPVVEGEDGDGVREGEFMEEVFDWLDGHREEEHFGIIHGAEEFLKLREGGDDGDVPFCKEAGGFRGE